jgi:FkbH-like protein
MTDDLIPNGTSLLSNDLPTTLVELLRLRATRQANAIGYTFLAEGEAEQDPTTYGQLDLQARTIAAHLQRKNLAGQRALLLFPSGISPLAAFFGCLYARVVPIPCSISRIRRERGSIKSLYIDAEPSVALCTQAQLPALKRSFEEEGIRLPLFGTNSLPTDCCDEWDEPDCGADDVAYLQYTSGSTSSPKGVAISHRNVLHNLSYIDADFQHSETSASVTWLPYYHDMGLIYGLLQPLYNAFPCWIMSPTAMAQHPIRWLKAITKFRATHSGGPNFAYDLCVRSSSPDERQRGLQLNCWRVAFVGAEPVRHRTLESFAEVFGPAGFSWDSFYPAYGLAEASLKVTGGRPGEKPALLDVQAESLETNQIVIAACSGPGTKRLVGCGSSAHGVEVIVVHPDTHVPCRDLEVGEIWVSGPSNARGYWNRLAETSETFYAHMAESNRPFLRTGDMGFLHNRELFVTGRSKDLIIIRGQNHWPQDIEETAENCHPALGQAVAFSVVENDLEKLVILQEIRRRAGVDLDDAMAVIRRSVARHHDLEVATVALVDKGKLLRTSSGKKRRHDCRASFLRGTMEIVAVLNTVAEEGLCPASSEEFVAIRDPIQRRERCLAYIVEAAARISGTDPDRIDPSQPANYLPLDSLHAIRLQAQLEKALHVSFPPFVFLQSTSINELAAVAVESMMQTSREVPKTSSIVPRPLTEGTFPLSYEQERIWMLSQREPDAATYNLCVSFPILGCLNVDALQSSLNYTLGRHPVLRASFPVVNGSLMQRIRDFSDSAISLIDLSSVPPARLPQALAGIAGNLYKRPFDLSVGPMLRWCLVRISETEHTFFMAAHHIIIDAASFDIFRAELASSYSDCATGKPSSLSPVSRCYLDFVVWDRNRSKEADFEMKREFWRERLSPPLRQICLPGQRLQSAKSGTSQKVRALPIHAELAALLRQVSRREGVTLFMLLLAAFKSTLCLLSGETDITLPAPTSGRTHPDTGDVIGFFAYPVLFRTDLSGDPTFREILRRVRLSVLAALAHGNIPFSAVIEALRPSAIRNASALTDLMFNFVTPSTEPVACHKVTMGPLDLRKTTSDVGILLNIVSLSSGLSVSLVYDSYRFSESTVEAVLSLYSEIIGCIVDTPDARLSCVVPATKKESAWKISVASSFVAEPILEILEFWREELDLPWEVEFAPYGQVMQSILDPGGLCMRNQNGDRVLLIRLEDWAAGGEHSLRQSTLQVTEAISALAQLDGGHILVCCCPPSVRALADDAFSLLMTEMEQSVTETLSGLVGVEVVTSAEIAALYPLEQYDDPFGNRSAHIPYLPQWFAAMGTIIARKLYRLHFPPHKVIVVDCDQTLWTGVCAEDGALHVVVDSGRRALQDFLLCQQQNGKLLCLCSKNSLDDVRAVFETQNDMVLRWPDFVSVRVNWQSKSANLTSMAKELGIGLDRFIFLDDNPVECAEVRSNCPEILTIQIDGSPKEALALLKRNWAFDWAKNTREGAARTSLYKVQREREILRRQSPTLREYLVGLDVKVHVRPMLSDDIARVSELTFRVTQFNFTSIRRSERDIQQLLLQGFEGFVVEVVDRLGPYGLAGVLFFQKLGNAIDVDTFLLSCRTLGRGVEHTMLAALGRLAQQRECTVVRLKYRPTKRNLPALAFLRQASGHLDQETGGEQAFEIHAEQARNVRYEPPDVPPNVNDMVASQQKASEPSSDLQWGEILRLQKIASVPDNPCAILRSVNARRTKRRASKLACFTQHQLRLHSGIKDALILFDEQSGKAPRIVACVSTADPRKLAAQELQKYLSETKAEVCLPSTFLIVEDLPRTADGRMDLTRLGELVKSVADDHTEDRPASLTEQRLIPIWAETLGLPSVGVTQDFFELGGHSIMAMQILSRVRDLFRVDLPPTVLFTTGLTIAGLARAIEQQRSES